MNARAHIALLLPFVAFAARAEMKHPLLPTDSPYRLYEKPERTDLLTPNGKKEIYGDYGVGGNSSYRIEIPIAALQPTPSPSATPTPKATLPPISSVPTLAPEGSLTPTVCATLSPTGTITPTGTETPLPSPSPTRRPASFGQPGGDEDIAPLVVKANHLFTQRRLLESSELVDEILRRRPDYVRGWLMRGSVHYALGHKDLAREAWMRAQELDPSNETTAGLLERYR